MTCIVGLVERDGVWMGGDSASASGSWDLCVRADHKVFRNGPMLFGFTTSFRMGQLLRYALSVPDHDPRVDIDRYMATTFVDAVRSCLKVAGYAKRDSDQESGGTFLVAFKGRLFSVHDDYQVATALDGFYAVGSGDQVARGALFATMGHPDPRARLELCLRAAERCCAGVRGPFTIEKLEEHAPPAQKEAAA